jgi:hypothetical protein
LVGEESPEAKLERKAQELRNKIQAFAENKKQPKADTEPDVKYSRSLDDIKEEYSSWLYQQKKKQNVFSKKNVFIITGATAVMIAGYFILSVLPSQNITGERILSAQEILASAPVLKTSTDSLKAGKSSMTATGKKETRKKINTAKSRSALAHDSYLKKEVKEVDTYLDSLNAVQKKSQAQKQTAYEPTSKKEDGTGEKTIRNAEVTGDNSSVKNETNSVPFEELVKLAESANGTPHLTLYNNSKKFIKFVAVDAYYYKANKKLLQKKTLYFTDISAMSSAKLFVPEEKKAVSVRYEMGLISTGGGLYYAKN